MLKTYEDMIYTELMSLSIKPKSNLTRTDTEIFMQLPKKLNQKNNSRLPKINTKNSIPSAKGPNSQAANLPQLNYLDNIDIRRHKYIISKQLDMAMKILDAVKKKKAELNKKRLNQRYQSFNEEEELEKVNNLFKAYEMWKANWNKFINS